MNLALVSATQGQRRRSCFAPLAVPIDLEPAEQGGQSVTFVVQTVESAAETAGGRAGETAFTEERSGSAVSGTIYQLEGTCRWPTGSWHHAALRPRNRVHRPQGHLLRLVATLGGFRHLFLLSLVVL
jgi:hypothetical protein